MTLISVQLSYTAHIAKHIYFSFLFLKLSPHSFDSIYQWAHVVVLRGKIIDIRMYRKRLTAKTLMEDKESGIRVIIFFIFVSSNGKEDLSFNLM